MTIIAIILMIIIVLFAFVMGYYLMSLMNDRFDDNDEIVERMIEESSTTIVTDIYNPGQK